MKRYMRLVTVAILVAIALFSASASADADKRFEEIAQGWFDSHNSGDAEVMRAFIAKYRTAAALEQRPVDARVERRMGIFGQIGAIEPRDVVRQTDSTIVYKAFAPKVEMWLECGFVFEVGDEVKLIELSIRPTAAPENEVSDVEWETVGQLLEQVAGKAKLPGIAAAVVLDDEIVELAVFGTREWGGDDKVAIDDRWHIGSVSKSVTATMIAGVVASGALSWETTVGDALSDIEMRDEYRDVTLADLMHHLGGIQPYTMVTAEDEARLAALTGDGTAVRTGFAREVLAREPANLRGQHGYSNAGYTLAALMAERAAGAQWADLVREYVFAPAGLPRAGFGWPATPERPDQPRGHFLEGDTLRVQGLEEYPLGDYVAPAGDIHMSIEDLAQYARLHLRGLAGQVDGLDADAFAWLHTPGESDGSTRYAAGWVITDHPEMGETHWHNGSAGTFYAVVALYPARGLAVVAATSGSLQRGSSAVDRVVEMLSERVKQETEE